VDSTLINERSIIIVKDHDTSIQNSSRMQHVKSSILQRRAHELPAPFSALGSQTAGSPCDVSRESLVLGYTWAMSVVHMRGTHRARV
jgi:tRNA(Met) C34 N-acetyltransferase TmcA